MLARERALQIAESYVGIREAGRNNTGPLVEMFQRADTLPGEIYAWCQSFMNGCWRLATGGRVVHAASTRPELVGGLMLADGTASCGIFTGWCRQRGYMVEGSFDRPRRGDHITFLFDADRWADHVGQIASVTRVLPGLLYLVTVEGNTGSSGSVSDPGTGRDGVYKKRRVVRRSMCNVMRVPGEAVDVPQSETPERSWPLPIPDWFWPWAKWRLHDRPYHDGDGFPNLEHRPWTPDPQVPAWAFRRLLRLQQERAQD